MNYNKPLIIMLGTLTLIYFFAGNPNDPVKTQIEKQKIGSSYETDIKNLNNSVKFTQINTPNKYEIEILGLYERLYRTEKIVRQSIEHGDKFPWVGTRDESIKWLEDDLKFLNDAINDIGYPVSKINALILKGTYKGDIKGLQTRTKEILSFLYMLRPQPKK